MSRTFTIALFSATMVVAACKNADKPAGDPAARAAAVADKPTPVTVAAKATGSAAPAADPGKNSELETRGIALMQQIADLFAADGKDCEKLGADVKAFVAKHRPLLVELTTMEKAQSPAERTAFDARNHAVQEAVAEKMSPAMTACREHPSLIAAMKDFPGD